MKPNERKGFAFLAVLGVAAASVSLIANGPKAWPHIKKAGRESWCVVSTLKRCRKIDALNSKPIDSLSKNPVR